ncbi:MAG: DUF4835 family protein [Bacteroidales bacterium]|nr:DUF4835 family protein [Bacteroidales bacterium]
MKLKGIVVLGLMLALAAFRSVGAQEFRCAVGVNYQKLMTTTQSYESADKKVFENMKQAIEDFVNGRRWTNIDFEQQERIDCSITLVLNTRTSATDFAGQLSVQMRRPVYNSTYTSGLFNYIEGNNFVFSYNESQPLDFDMSTFYSNLASALAYYCYVMLGIYFDSYMMNGGEPFYQAAQQVQQAVPNDRYAGWDSRGAKNRYWFMENHTNSAYAQLHEAYYNYHRMGLDMMTKDQPQARQAIIASLRNIMKVNKAHTNLLSVQQFVDVKIQEIVSIFTPAPPQEQKEVYDLIKEISPINVVKLKDFNTK